MSILLTGGSGFIGGHFHRYLQGSNIVNFDLNDPPSNYQSIFFKGDIRVKDDVKRVFHQHSITSIISLAAKHHDFGIGHDEYFDTNEDGTRVLCEVASEHNIREIIFFSSVAVYGTHLEISRETMAPHPDGPYGASKLAGEKVLEKWATENPSRKVLIIRPTVAFGPGNFANMFNLIKQINSGLYFYLGKADNIKSIAYVENLVAATIFLKNKMLPGLAVYNYADEPQLTTKQIAQEIAKNLGVKIRFTIPKALGIAMAIPFDVIIKLTGKNLPISTARVRKLGTPTHHSAAKLFAEGFKPQFSTQEGLQKMVAWYKTKPVNEIKGH